MHFMDSRHLSCDGLEEKMRELLLWLVPEDVRVRPQDAIAVLACQAVATPREFYTLALRCGSAGASPRMAQDSMAAAPTATTCEGDCELSNSSRSGTAMFTTRHWRIDPLRAARGESGDLDLI